MKDNLVNHTIPTQVMRMIRALFLILAAALALAACTALPTPYQPIGESRYGYAEEQIDAETWRVRFSGNSVTDRAAVVDYVFYRAAEIAVAQEADGVIVLKEDIERDVSYYASPNPYPNYPRSAFFFGRGHRHSHFGVGVGTGTVQTDQRYTDHLRIRLFRDAAPEGLGQAYDAQKILETFAPKIVRPPAPEG